MQSHADQIATLLAIQSFYLSGTLSHISTQFNSSFFYNGSREAKRDTVEYMQKEQESCAIAKMTARCALYK